MMIGKAMLLAGALGLVALSAGSVRAQSYTTQLKGATIYKTAFVRAADSCTGDAVTVHVSESGLPASGCVANDTDNLAFGKATLTLHKAHGKYVLTANGLPPGQEVHLVLNLQITRKNTTTGQGLKDVTFAPVEAECATIAANTKGVVVQKATLDTCTPSQKLADPTPGPDGGTDSAPIGFAALNTEVLGATLINDTTGKAFASAGISR